MRRNTHEAPSYQLLLLRTKTEQIHKTLSAIQVLKYSKEHFLLVNDSEKDILMFSCTTNIQFLRSIDVL